MKKEEKQEEQQNKATAVDYLNSEWAQDMIQAKNKIALLTEENVRLKNVVDKQKKAIEAFEKKEKISAK